MEPSEPRDDEQYPAAPLPQHERMWRHPSEIGEAAWVRTEPPLVIGRGLLTTTSVIGAVLGLAVLWAMLPAASNGGVTALSTVASRTIDKRTVAAGLTRDTEPIAPTTTQLVAALSSTTSSLAPVPTFQVSPQLLSTSPGIAVAVGDRALVITTASAVAERTSVTISLPSGDNVEARVIAVDDARGLAVLAPVRPAVIDTFEISPMTLREGDLVTALGIEPMTLTISLDDLGTPTVGDGALGDLAEGTPVVDGEGRLVGLCSGASGRSELVMPADMTSTMAWLTQVLGGVAWLGVHLNADPGGDLTVAAIDPDGPAALAGLVAGDTIRTIDGTSVDSVDTLGTVLGAHFPGDQITVGVTLSTGELVEMALTLGARAPSM